MQKEDEEAFNEHFDIYGAFYEGLDLRKLYGRLYQTMFVFRRMMLAYTLIYMSNRSGFQIQALITINIVFLILNGKYMSFLSRNQNYIELVNEVITMVSYYHLFFFSDMVQNIEFKFQAGYTLVYCSIVCALFNFSVIGHSSFRQIRG